MTMRMVRHLAPAAVLVAAFTILIATANESPRDLAHPLLRKLQQVRNVACAHAPARLLVTPVGQTV